MRVGLGTGALLGLFWGSAAVAACEAPASRAAVGLAISEAQTAFIALDIDRFNVAHDRVFTLVPCLVDPLLPADVARVHTLVALAAFRDGQDEAGVNAWRAALAADPAFDLAADLAPPGHPLRVQLDVARELHGATLRPLGQIAPEVWLVDGRPGAESPLDRPTLLQWQTVDRRVKENAYLRPGEALPSWAVPAPAPRVTVIAPVEPVVAVLPVVAAPEPAPTAAPTAAPAAPVVAAPPPVERPTEAAVAPKDPAPPMVLAPAAAPDAPARLPEGPPEAKPREKKHRPWGMAVATVALAGASGTSWYYAREAQTAFLTPPGSYPENPDDLQVRANLLGWTSVGTGAASLIFATATLVDW